MHIKLSPRKANDVGGIYCMPLAEVVKKQGAKGMCTMCALKKGVLI